MRPYLKLEYCKYSDQRNFLPVSSENCWRWFGDMPADRCAQKVYLGMWCGRLINAQPRGHSFICQGGELMIQNHACILCPSVAETVCSWDLVQCSSPLSTRGCNLCITELQGELTLTHSVTLIISLTWEQWSQFMFESNLRSDLVQDGTLLTSEEICAEMFKCLLGFVCVSVGQPRAPTVLQYV